MSRIMICHECGDIRGLTTSEWTFCKCGRSAALSHGTRERLTIAGNPTIGDLSKGVAKSLRDGVSSFNIPAGYTVFGARNPNLGRATIEEARAAASALGQVVAPQRLELGWRSEAAKSEVSAPPVRRRSRPVTARPLDTAPETAPEVDPLALVTQELEALWM